MSISGCALTTFNTSSSHMNYSYSNFNEVKDREISIESDSDKLILDGTINLKDGKVNIYVKVKNSGEEL